VTAESRFTPSGERGKAVAATSSDVIRDLRYATAELRTRGEIGLADIVEQATNELVKRGVPAGTPAGPDSESGSCPATGEGVSVELRVLPGASGRLAELEQRLERLSAESEETDAEVEKLRGEIGELEARSIAVRRKLGTLL
jgi:hypothetical protein